MCTVDGDNLLFVSPSQAAADCRRIAI